jgi:naringenin degradation protein FdeH
MDKAIRRVVTGHDREGHAIVISDGPAPSVHRNDLHPDFRSTEIWRTFEIPVPISAASTEPTGGPRRQLPASNGTVLRINSFPPDSNSFGQMTPQQSADVFAKLGNRSASTFAHGGRHPLMHRTETVDYAIVLSGEITMVLDKQDVDLKAGDVVVQCGTNHAWSNRSAENCVIAFVLIDGRFAPELKRPE